MHHAVLKGYVLEQGGDCGNHCVPHAHSRAAPGLVGHDDVAGFVGDVCPIQFGIGYRGCGQININHRVQGTTSYAGDGQAVVFVGVQCPTCRRYQKHTVTNLPSRGVVYCDAARSAGAGSLRPLYPRDTLAKCTLE